MNITVITESRLDELLDTAFNPATVNESFSEHDFYSEWKNGQDELKQALLHLGYSPWNDGGDDYTMADDWGLSRNHDIEIHTKEMLFDSNLLPAIQRTVQGFTKDYRVIVHHDLFLRTTLGQIHFIITKDQSLVQSKSEEILKCFILQQK